MADDAPPTDESDEEESDEVPSSAASTISPPDMDPLFDFPEMGEVGVPDLASIVPDESETPSLADRIAEARDAPDLFTTERRKRSEPFSMSAAPDASAAVSDDMDFTTYEVEVDREMAQKLLSAIHKKLRECKKRHHEVDQLVLGLPQYAVLRPWARSEHDCRIVKVLSVDEVIVVPGPMIHPVADTDEMYYDYLSNRDDDEE